jgi:hypothetical protein
LTGGREVWQAITEFFDGLDRRSRPAGDGKPQEATWQT